MYTSIAGSEGRHIGVNAHAQIAYMVTEFGKNIYQENAYKVTRINPLSINHVRGNHGGINLPSYF